MEPNFDKFLQKAVAEKEDIFIPITAQETADLAEIESDSDAMLAASEDMGIGNEEIKNVLSKNSISTNTEKTEKELSSGNGGFSFN